MDKRGNFIVIASVIVIVLFIIVGIIIFLFIGLKHPITSEVDKNLRLPNVTIYLSARDSATKSQQEANYFIIGSDSSLYFGNTTENSYIPLNIKINQTFDAYCYNDDYYFGKVSKSISTYDLGFNKTLLDCYMRRIGTLKVNKIDGNIQNLDNIITINLTSERGEFHKLGACFSRSAGITSLNLDNNYLICDSFWKNFSSYNSDKKKYYWLPKDTYLCGDNQIEKCKSVSGTLCKTSDIEMPWRFSRNYDSCKYFGYDLYPGDSKTININVQTSTVKNSFDFLKIVFFDYDQRLIDDNVTYVNSDNGKDIASKDQEIQIDYKLN